MQIDNPNIDHHLRQWARWCRIDDTNLGYPKRSLCFIGGGESQRWDDYIEDHEQSEFERSARCMDAIITDLKAYEQQVLRAVYLGEHPAVLRRPRLADILDRIADKLLSGMREKNVI